ncbi:hypothetical protein N869_15535 [Cellulomonas bogoriensis 69B4 = DSM 16987]|uniref:Enoyl-CoA hydratase n=1 Tax=Cellulomonas bogoriensis 69B4 = DSM 16987 TaxID=1386082 RepID=A0A0A0BZA5_9CELL|nr:DUF3000 domain-containing protein [Cellulomonas bogoriensis]KGM13221.1 hypothetical protein N869_15535 [Cellulomonas bogoriensis 69B4 = DSM 16987]
MTTDADVPQVFVRALHALRDQRLRPEVLLTEVPAPGRIAPYAVALTGDLQPPGRTVQHEDPASGRFVLLHDPDGQEAWQGTFRVVTLVRASLDPEAGADPLLCEVAWSWVVEALTTSGAEHSALGGTVTRVVSQSFGALRERPDETEVEVRASWTPAPDGVGRHLAAWSGVLCHAGGLAPLPEGVASLSRRR